MLTSIHDTAPLVSQPSPNPSEIGLLSKQAFGEPGVVYFPNQVSDTWDTPHRIHKADLSPPEEADGEISFSAVTPELEHFVDFDVNSTGDVAAIYRHRDLGHVATLFSEGETSFLVPNYRLPESDLERTPRPARGKRFATITVTYSEKDTAIDLDTIDSEDVIVSGPNGQSRVEPYRTSTVDGREVEVHYAWFPQNRYWGPEENGQYEIQVAAGAVQDVFGSPSRPGEVREIQVNLDPYYSEDDSLPDASLVIQDEGRYELLRSAFPIEANVEGSSEFVRFRQIALSDDHFVGIAGTVGSQPFISRTPLELGDEGAAETELYVAGEFEAVTEIDVENGGLLAAVGKNDHTYTILTGAESPQPLLTRTNPKARRAFHSIDLATNGEFLIYLSQTRESDPHDAPLGPLNFSSSIFSFHFESGREQRLAGGAYDGSLDFGEYWEDTPTGKDDTGSGFVDIKSASLVEAGDRGYYVSYSKSESWYAEGDGGVFDVSRFNTGGFLQPFRWLDGNANVGPPILVSAFDARPEATGGSRKIRHVSKVVASYDPAEDRFSAVSALQTQPLLNRSPVSHSLHWSSGELPSEVDPDLEDGQDRHAFLERIAREVAYRELRDPSSRFQIGTVLPEGYVVAAMYVSLGLPDEFAAVGLFPVDWGLDDSQPSHPPILAFRGTDSIDDFTGTNLDHDGVGYSQYNDWQDWFRSWMASWAGEGQTPPILTGHSLGGALTQWFAYDAFMRGHSLTEAVTFQSPGIGETYINLIRDDVGRLVEDGIEHYVVSGDIVSLAGEAFLPGNVTIVKPSDGFLLNSVLFNLRGWLEFPRHRGAILNDALDVAADETVERIDTVSASKFSDSVYLGHPAFNYMGDSEYYALVRWIAEWISEPLSQLLVSRQRVEAIRKQLGAEDLSEFSFWQGVPALMQLALHNRTDKPVYVFPFLDPSDPVSNTSVQYDWQQNRLRVKQDVAVVVASPAPRVYSTNSRTLGWTRIPADDGSAVGVFSHGVHSFVGVERFFTGLNRSSGQLEVVGSYFGVPRGVVHFPGNTSSARTYLMHTVSDARIRFGLDASHSSSAVAVRYHDGWEVFGGRQWRDFIPESGDRIIGSYESDRRRIDLAEADSNELHGMPAGVTLSTLRFEPLDTGGDGSARQFVVSGDFGVASSKEPYQSMLYVAAGGEHRVDGVKYRREEGVEHVVTAKHGKIRVGEEAYIYTAPRGGIPEDVITVSVRVDGQNVRSERVLVKVSSNDRQNASLHADVNGDFRVKAIDALIVINALSRFGGPVSVESLDSDYFEDVSGDGVVAAIDALKVINELARNHAEEHSRTVRPDVSRPFSSQGPPETFAFGSGASRASHARWVLKQEYGSDQSSDHSFASTDVVFGEVGRTTGLRVGPTAAGSADRPGTATISDNLDEQWSRRRTGVSLLGDNPPQASSTRAGQ